MAFAIRIYGICHLFAMPFAMPFAIGTFSSGICPAFANCLFFAQFLVGSGVMPVPVRANREELIQH
jgi:hypothetical protein